MKLKNLLLIWMFLLSGYAFAQQQKLALSNINHATLNTLVTPYDNPAFTGLHGAHNVQISYAASYLFKQGNESFPMQPKHFATLLYDVGFGKRKQHGLGLILNYDRQDAISKSEVYVNYTRRIKLADKIFIAPGIAVGFNQIRMDFSKLTFGDMIDPRYGYLFETKEQWFGPTRSFPDFKVGAAFGCYGLLAGFSANHITQPRSGFISTAKMPMVLHTFLQYNFKLHKHWNVLPALVLESRNDGMAALYVSPALQATWKSKLIAGFNWKNTSALEIQIGYQPIPQFRVMAFVALPTKEAVYEQGRINQLGGSMRYLSVDGPQDPMGLNLKKN